MFPGSTSGANFVLVDLFALAFATPPINHFRILSLSIRIVLFRLFIPGRVRSEMYKYKPVNDHY